MTLKPLWEREYPRLYRCKKCGMYELMRTPEPWTGHNCNDLDIDKMRKNMSETEVLKELGEYSFIAEGKDAIALLETECREVNFYIREEAFGWLSNFHREPITVDRKKCATVEHYYQSCKAKDPKVQEWIRNAPNAFQAMKAGDSLRPKELTENWNGTKIGVMLKGLRVKFKDPELKRKLLATGDLPIHEDSSSDMFWGVLGEDMLGRLLMQVRAELRR